MDRYILDTEDAAMKTSAVVFEKSGTGKTVVASKLHEGYMHQGERVLLPYDGQIQIHVNYEK